VAVRYQVESFGLSEGRSQITELPANGGISITFLPTPLYIVLDFERRNLGDRLPLEKFIQLVGASKNLFCESISVAIRLACMAFRNRAGFVFAVIIQ